MRGGCDCCGHGRRQIALCCEPCGYAVCADCARAHEPQARTLRLPLRLLAEFLGSFFVAFVTCICRVSHQPSMGFVQASALVACMIVLGSISGAHLNPAVSVAVALAGPRSFRSHALAYILVQLGGGVAAGQLAWQIKEAGPYWTQVFPTAPVGVQTWTHALSLEMGASAFAVFLHPSLQAAPSIDAERNNFFRSLAMGAAVLAGSTSADDVSGGLVNPVVLAAVIRAAGPSELMPAPLSNFLCYALFQVTGGCLAALLCIGRRAAEPPAMAAQAWCTTAAHASV